MSKTCVGCGITLQNNDLNELGYTPNLEKDYCMRCFKLKNYGENINKKVTFDNQELIRSINDFHCFTLFLTDFINISEEVLKTYKKIKTRKCLVITKKDLLPKNIHEERFISNIRKTYEIDSPIYFVSKNEDLSCLKNILETEKEIVVCGFTIAGKSTLINHLAGSNILESKEESTTLDWIKISTDKFTLYDTPGFVYKKMLERINHKKIIRSNPKKILGSEELKIDKYTIKSNVDNLMVLYIPNYINLVKRKAKTKLVNRVNVPANSDLVIKGLGFINIKVTCILETDFDLDILEVRDSLVGAKND